MNWHLYFSFLIASLVILLVPGPSFAYAVAVAGRSSRKAILLNVLGMGLGGMVIVLALAFGVATLLQNVPAAYTTLQIAGCAYMTWLGIEAFRSPSKDSSLTDSKTPPWAARAGPLLQGFLVETANPKSILFFSALIPQFVDPQLNHVQTQLLFLGVSFLFLQVTWDASLMLLVLRFRNQLGRERSPSWQRWTRWVSGTTFIGIGLALLLQGRPMKY